MDNGFFETDGSFVRGLEEGAKMIGRGSRSIPISMNLVTTRALSENDLGGDPEKYAGEEYAEGVEKAARQLYGLVQTDKAPGDGLARYTRLSGRPFSSCHFIGLGFQQEHGQGFGLWRDAQRPFGQKDRDEPGSRVGRKRIGSY